MLPPDQALARLREGNTAFATAVRDGAPLPCPELAPDRLAAPQRPLAAILTCADSRVTPEWIFQQGIGDIFVVRVAGDVPAVPCVESLEFAVAQLGVQLVVVLGHTHCGAVKATLAELLEPHPEGPLAIPDTMGRIMPALARLRGERPELAGDELEHAAIHADVHETVARLCTDSDILRKAVDAGELRVLGAVYDMAAGTVAFLEAKP
ncbi:MAG: carbonic anhydrase [bacterium]|nr:carbonic anhydrase [bacterium]